MPLFWVTWDPPTYTGVRLVLTNRTVDVAYVLGVYAHMGVTPGFTDCGVPGGKVGTWASSRCYWKESSDVRDHGAEADHEGGRRHARRVDDVVAGPDLPAALPAGHDQRPAGRDR